MIRTARDGALHTAVIDRPDKANSLTLEMLEALADFAEGAGQAGAQAIVLTGAGTVFSAGADLEAARAGLATSPVWERLSGAIAAFPGLSIAALNGTVAGGAMGMALACDLRLAVPEAKAFYPVMKLGFLPQPSDPGRLAALVGPARAKLMLMGGAKIGAEEAQAWGLFDRIVPRDDLMEAAQALAADTLAATPEHARAIKALCR
ncbi:enoyl-CoA hydratase/isomerase family protein [Rhodosalinus sediminis]|uniref:Enoyl-CoA hydratase/isomerase family protein n=1 Tax=Rhodosalinus sediminis TaxID=1940533 RepID=A0A3D9BXH7_9RHOB|nr:enoyl-CoA hydratase/isomerase family protein [Rhodosalinus sediminis]REC58227.1 enoyl-CoA hydratase/isomerase family protein [Rhodosalinus sediminis]